MIDTKASNTPIFDELKGGDLLPDKPIESSHELAAAALTEIVEPTESTVEQQTPTIKPKLEVRGHLSGTAKEMLETINEAIENGHPNLEGLSFEAYIDSGYYDKGVIAVSQHAALKRALEQFRIQEHRLTRLT